MQNHIFLIYLISIIASSTAFLWDSFNINRLFDGSDKIFEDLRSGATQSEIECLNQFKYFVDRLKLSDPWSLRVLDSWGKMPSGIESGNILDMGHYDQCYTTTHDSENQLIGVIDPLYCQLRLMDASTMRNISFSMALCVPKTCSASFMLEIMKKFLNNVDYEPINVARPLRCYDNQKESFGVIQWVTVVILLLLTVIIIASTVYDLQQRNLDRSKPNLLYKSFSLATNTDKLMEVRHDKSGQTMECLNGLRVVSIGYVVILHCFEYYGFTPAIFNRDGTENWERTWGHSFMRHGDAIVETFFCITGLLMSYNFLRARERGEKFNTVKYYIHRFFRIAPVYYAAILLVIAFIPYLGDGPSYQKIIEPALHRNCVQYWWSALLFIQNWVNPWIHTCIWPTWYISVDMQFFIISPIFLFMLVKWGYKCLYVFTGIILAVGAYIIALHEIRGYGFMGAKTDMAEMWETEIFAQSQNRIGPWLIGLLLGYHLFQTRNQQLVVSKAIFVFNWVLTVAIFVGIVTVPYFFYRAENNNVTGLGFFSAFHRVLWGLASAWLILACVKGRGGSVNWFFSFPIWQPLAKLTYCVYIIHNPIMLVTTLLQRTPSYYTSYLSLHLFFGVFTFSFVLAIPMALMFELPFMNAETSAFKLYEEKQRQKEETNKVTVET